MKAFELAAPPATRAKVVQDPAGPRFWIRVSRNRAPTLPSSGEGLLGEVDSLFPVAAPEVCECYQLGPVLLKELPELRLCRHRRQSPFARSCNDYARGVLRAASEFSQPVERRRAAVRLQRAGANWESDAARVRVAFIKHPTGSKSRRSEVDLSS